MPGMKRGSSTPAPACQRYPRTFPSFCPNQQERCRSSPGQDETVSEGSPAPLPKEGRAMGGLAGAEGSCLGGPGAGHDLPHRQHQPERDWEARNRMKKCYKVMCRESFLTSRGLLQRFLSLYTWEEKKKKRKPPHFPFSIHHRDPSQCWASCC